MTYLQILSKEEIKTFDTPPVCSGEERKKYFRLTVQLKDILQTFRSQHSRLGFLLHLGYFKATGRFYTYQSWHIKDVSYVASQLDLDENMMQQFQYKYTKQLFWTHKKLILGLEGKFAFQQKQNVFHHQLQLLIAKHIAPKKVFYALVDWLRIQKIEIPSYNFLSSRLTKALHLHEQKLGQLLQKHLTSEQMTQLNTLFIQEASPPYLFKLTTLKQVEQAEKPKKITGSVATFEDIKVLFKTIEPLIEVLRFTPDTWRAYARWVIQARSKQLLGLKDIYQRYLHAIAFIYHQYSYRQDCFIRILLNATNKVSSGFKDYEKEVTYQNREVQTTYETLLQEQLAHYQAQFLQTCAIIESPTSANTKVEAVQQVLIEVKSKLAAMKTQITELNKDKQKIAKSQLYHNWVKSQHAWLKNRVGGILKTIEFNETTSDTTLVNAIHHYRTLKETAFCRSIMPLFDAKTQKYMVDDKNRPIAPLCKALFYLQVGDALKAGKLNLKYSYRYRSIEEYLIPKEKWATQKQVLLQKAGLTAFQDYQTVLTKLKKQLTKQFQRTNENILTGKNEQVTIKADGEVTVHTPGVEEPDTGPVAALFEPARYTAIGDILLDIQHQTQFMDQLTHHGIKYTKARPHNKVFVAGLIGYGCNIGHHKMGQIAKEVNAATLLNTTNWYFSKENLDKANDQIVNLTKRLPLHTLFRHDKQQIHTSSDGQKYNTAVESLNASRSFKYFGTGKGVVVYSFVDEAIATFYATVIAASEREATYVLDGLLHNEVYWEEDKKWLHHTDTHGQTEVMFAATNLLGTSLAPRIKGIKKAQLYAFESPKYYKQFNYPLAPTQTIKEATIEAEWDTILRLMTTIRLKETTASSMFSRLSSYAKQNPLYQAIKEMGRIYRSLYILKYYDELKLRQLTEKQLNKTERVHQFAHAVFFDNNSQIKLELKEEQDTAMACRVIIQNAIILWNYLKITQQLLKEENQENKDQMMAILRNGSACTWQHVNFHGEYEFGEESTSNLRQLNLEEMLDMKIA